VRIFTYFFVIQLLVSTAVFANCELIENETVTSYQEFKEAESLHSDQQYSEAYDMLLKSFRSYSPRTKEIQLKYTCVNYIPGPYAPTIQKSSKTEMFDFDRTSLAMDIKHQLSPAPYVFIQFQKSKTLVSAVNSIKTSRNTIEKRLPLESFSVTVDGDKFDFGNLQVGKLETLTKNKTYTPNATITTNEEFGFKLYK